MVDNIEWRQADIKATVLVEIYNFGVDKLFI